jgi:alkyldihydroxyacetonephosphate synthase
VLGSEGTLGVITEAWVRLQDAPRFRASGRCGLATTSRAWPACARWRNRA